MRSLVGRNVRRTREARDKTAKWLADEVGVSDATMTRIEQGAQSITTDVLDRIALALGTTSTALMRLSVTREKAVG